MNYSKTRAKKAIPLYVIYWIESLTFFTISIYYRCSFSHSFALQFLTILLLENLNHSHVRFQYNNGNIIFYLIVTQIAKVASFLNLIFNILIRTIVTKTRLIIIFSQSQNSSLPIISSEEELVIYLRHKRSLLYGNKTWISSINGLNYILIKINRR